jgi:hypothetical protein
MDLRPTATGALGLAAHGILIAMGFVLAALALALLIVLGRLASPGASGLLNRRRADSADRVVRLPPPAAGMGRDRVPGLWDMSLREAPPASPGGSPGVHPVPIRAIRSWAAGAAGFAVLAVVAWVTGYPPLGVFTAMLGVFALGVALHGWRKNRWFERAKAWNTGHRHDFPPAEGGG